MPNTERQQALNILIKVLHNKISLTAAMTSSAATQKSNPNYSPFTKEICFGVCRYYFQLEAIANSLVYKKPKNLHIWLIILIGLYQLHYLHTPEHAAVKETVDLLNKKNLAWAKSLVNGVLRSFCRKKKNLLETLENNLDYTYNHPNWLITRLQQDWPKNWQIILANNDKHPPLSLRVNQKKLTRAAYLDKLKSKNIQAYPHNYSPVGLSIQNPCTINDLPGFQEGEISVQDEAAQLAVPLLMLTPKLRVLDACCAPGGKTCHILETHSDIECLALDKENSRLKYVTENLCRLGLYSQVLAGNALTPQNWWDGKAFQRILLDAPCSATGVIRRHPDIKLLRTPDEIVQIAILQKNLLQALWPLLDNNGTLVYATCSLMHVENEQQIANFVQNTPDCECLPISSIIATTQTMSDISNWGEITPHGLQILPGSDNSDGFFYSVLMKKVKCSTIIRKK